MKNNKKYFLPRGEIKNYYVLTDETNFSDQPVHDLIKHFDEVRNVSTGPSDDYITVCLLDSAYFEDSDRLITVDLRRQKALDADPRAIRQIAVQGVAGRANDIKITLYTILEKSKETVFTHLQKHQQK